MPKGAQTSLDLMALALMGKVPSWTKGDRFLALHTSDPSEGSQETAEVSYPGYARQLCMGWTAETDIFFNTDPVEFPISIGSATPAVTHVSVGTRDGQILYAGRLKTPLSIAFNQRLRIEAGELVISEH